MKPPLLLLLLIAGQHLPAQFQIRLEVTAPAGTASEKIYLAGNFNNWNPKDEDLALEKKSPGIYSLVLPQVTAGTYEFKLTCGSWETVETDSLGHDIANHEVSIGADTVLQLKVKGWKAAAAAIPRHSTASPQVHILDTAFSIPELGRTRRIWIYLPKDYGPSKKSFPVLYMQDGQNLFDDSSSFSGEWGVDEALDSLPQAGIVVGIDNGGKYRMNEYNPDDNDRFGKGEGRLYLTFIVKELKPYIDRHYRTLADKAHTGIAGSSMGGLISFYAGLYYPGVFGQIGVFSPSFWIVPALPAEMKTALQSGNHQDQQYYFYCGSKEGGQMDQDTRSYAARLGQQVHARQTVTINPEGQHNEKTWRGQFPAFYRWISSATKTSKN